jgi:predicted transcriptional regulator
LRVDRAYSREARTLNLQSTIRDAIDLTLTTFQSEFPVWDGGQLVGLLMHHQLLETLNQRGSETLVREVMLTHVKPVSPDADLFDVQQRMAEQKLEAVPVEKDGRFLGLLTVQDVSELYQIATSYPRRLSNAAQN